MNFIVALVVGLIVGAIAKALMPGKDPGGFIITALIGVAGAMLATFLGHQMNMYGPGEAGGFIASIIGAMLLLGLYRLVRRPLT
jgi:uncharacterized membrane protein YeaQ/YmgE (transglycosylase-associated protein family)